MPYYIYRISTFPLRRLELQQKGLTEAAGQVLKGVDFVGFSTYGEQVNGIYEADYRDFNRETYMRGRETFDATWAGVKRLLYGIWRRDEAAQAATQGVAVA